MIRTGVFGKVFFERPATSEVSVRRGVSRLVTKLLCWLSGVSQPLRAAFLTAVYGVELLFYLWLSYQLRFDLAVPREFLLHMVPIAGWVVPVELAALLICRQFDGFLSYFSTPDLRRLFLATAGSSLVMGLAYMQGGVSLAPPRGVILTNFILAFTGLASGRLGLRVLRQRYLFPAGHPRQRARRVGIIGGGEVGARLAQELMSKPWLALQPTAFFESFHRPKSSIHGLPVVGPPEALLDPLACKRFDEIIIAMPDAPAKRIGEIVKILNSVKLKFRTVPSMEQLATGTVTVSHLRQVEIQDLLRRKPVDLHIETIRDILEGKVVMVTGAGGSIGSELCRQLAAFKPHQLLLVEQSEVQMFAIEQELAESGHGGIISPLIADIVDLQRMRSIFERYHPSIVFHAAAHKHVPMMESQAGEAIKNNALGTAQVAKLALEFGVERFVLISSDKAINPTNVMGATKRLAEMFLQSLAASCRGSTKFMAVRFGNVLGSSGSVVPIFNRQIAAGGPVKVTHPDVTRYFMTIPEAAGLVLQSAAQGTGGEVFLLDMGNPIKIADLARQLIELNGLKPGEDVEIQYTGLRPGEKLFEELNHEVEKLSQTDHPKIRRYHTDTPVALDKLQRTLDLLRRGAQHAGSNELKLLLQEAVPEYCPFFSQPV